MAAVGHTATLARLSFWVPPGRMAEFETVYEQKAVPLLKKHGLVETAVPRPPVEGVFSRFFALENLSEFLAREQALRKDPAWRELLQGLGTAFGPPGPDRLIPHRFGVCEAPAGPGRTAEAGSGYRHGLWLNLGTQDGLPFPVVLAIIQDRQGNLWFGTDGGGVCRYDGEGFTVFTVRDGLGGNAVHSILEDREGDLWFGLSEGNKKGEYGVSRYDGERFVTFTPEDGLGCHANPIYDDEVSSIAEDREGNLWFGTGGGVSRYTGEQFKTFTCKDGLLGTKVCFILEDREGNLWFGTWGGASRYTGEQFVNFTTEEGLGHGAVESILQDRQGNLWFGTYDGGVSRYDGERFKTFTTADGLADNGVKCILEDHEGVLWLGTHRGGVSRYDGERFKTFTTEGGLMNNAVMAVLEDREGYLWFGTLGGISRYDRVHFTLFTTREGLPNNGAMSLLEDREGRLWAGTWNGACRYEGGRFFPVEGLAGIVRSMAEDEKGHLWFGNNAGHGVSRYDGRQLIAFTSADGLVDDWVTSVLEDREGYLWFGALRGVSRYDGEQFVNFTTEDGLAHNQVTFILEDREGHLWFGTNEGVSRYDGEQFVNFTTEDGLAHNAVWPILEDRRGRLWFGTNGGVSRYDGEQFVNFTTEDGLANDMVTSLMEDRQGHLWISTFGGGVSRYDGWVFQTLSRQDGLPHNAAHQILQDRCGDFWIATEGGVARYRPRRTPPRVRITDVIADQRYGPVQEVHLPLSHRLVAFEFRARCWTTPPERMVYVYRLEGYEADWQVTRKPRVEYQGLALGEYTFQVRAVDRDLNYSAPATVELTVEPDPRIEALTEVLSGPTGEFIGNSPALRQVLAQLEQVAPTDLTVLILGETGTGKGLASRTLHRLSPRRKGPFIQVSCGAIPRDLVENELFGHERGAFTGALPRKLGKVELAQGGTLLLDEIGDLAPEAQVKLLRVLEEGTFERVGGTETFTADVRVVAATNRDLTEMVAKEQFREDLYYRLQVFVVRLPPLRQRREDIPVLATHFMRRMAAHLDKEVSCIAPEAMAALMAYDWPGNIRELEHAMQRAVIVCPGPTVRAEDIALELAPRGTSPAEELSPEEYERRYLLRVLEECGWVVKGPQGAAARLGTPSSTLQSRMKKLGIRRSM